MALSAWPAGSDTPEMALFRDRADAGARLATALQGFRGPDVLVLGIPRGGVPVAAIVAHALGGELDIIVARKAGAPGNPELAIGAVTPDGTRDVNDDVVQALAVTAAELDDAFTTASREAAERERRFRGTRPKPKLHGRTVIVVDDGIATGATIRAAIRSIRKSRPSRLVIAVPVGAPESCAENENEVARAVAGLLLARFGVEIARQQSPGLRGVLCLLR